jgi:16S rRNA (uracil1498-N3)-methyltransferase
MAFDPNIIRLYVTADLAAGASLQLTRDQAHYLGTVMRRKAGDDVHLFNGRDGEWRCAIRHLDRKKGVLRVDEQSLEQINTQPLTLLFAPLKRSAMDFVVQKATELGVTDLQPVLTERTTTRRVNAERMESISLEAAEQCERLDLPTIHEPLELATLLHEELSDRKIIFCDEGDDVPPMLHALQNHKAGGHWSILIGPEGGFTAAERALLRGLDNVVAVGIGPRILRADTAAVAALALYQAALGDF